MPLTPGNLQQLANTQRRADNRAMHENMCVLRQRLRDAAELRKHLKRHEVRSKTTSEYAKRHGEKAAPLPQPGL